MLKMHLVCANNDNNIGSHISPPEAFMQSYTCNHTSVLESFDTTDNFFNLVLAARHTTATPEGWQVDIPSNSKDVADDEEQPYARVFDMLNWSRENNLLPVPIDISTICHKGMEAPINNRNGMTWREDGKGNTLPLPTKPNRYISDADWSSLWNVCHKQLSSKQRVSSSCIDIPGIVVETNKNPCNLKYRLVDGAHRMCLRKYLLTLLRAEIIQREEQLPRESVVETFEFLLLLDEIEWHKELIPKVQHGMFLVLNETTFLESMLQTSNPHKSWAKSKEFMVKDVELRKWKEWMGRMMTRVDGYYLSTTNDTSHTTEALYNTERSREEL